MVKNRLVNFTYENIKIQLKILKEYKTNTLTAFFVNIVYMGMLVLVFYSLKLQFNNIFYWKNEEFILFLIFLEIYFFIAISWFRSLRIHLLTGDFNKYLLKPINTMFNYAVSTIDYVTVPLMLFYISLECVYFAYYWNLLDIFRLSTAMLFALFGAFLYIASISVTDSLAFFIKQNRFLSKPYDMTGEVFTKYPVAFFEGSIIEKLSYFIGTVYFSSYAISFYFGYISYEKLFVLWSILIVLIILLSTSTYFLWKFGLKRYEAYG